jgi:hypothetical protein
MFPEKPSEGASNIRWQLGIVDEIENISCRMRQSGNENVSTFFEDEEMDSEKSMFISGGIESIVNIYSEPLGDVAINDIVWIM